MNQRGCKRRVYPACPPGNPVRMGTYSGRLPSPDKLRRGLSPDKLRRGLSPDWKAPLPVRQAGRTLRPYFVATLKSLNIQLTIPNLQSSIINHQPSSSEKNGILEITGSSDSALLLLHMTRLSQIWGQKSRL